MYDSEDRRYVCKNCKLYINEGKIPKIALCRGLMFPVIPPQLVGLTTIEQRLISPRHEFMNIRSLGRERQVGLHGMIVNVPIDINKTVNQLPRTFQQSQTIQLQLFRKMSFSKPYLYETIRPNLVQEAALYLSNTELFKQEKVVFSVDWVKSVKESDKDINFIVNPNDIPSNPGAELEDTNMEFSSVEPDSEDLSDLADLLKVIDDWDETKDDLPINPGSLDTLLISNEDVLLKLAPGEGRKPLHLSRDEFVEELAYPCVFAGVTRDLPEDLSVLKKAKSDILRLVIHFNLFFVLLIAC